jgi:RHS repeat-associated protein
MYVANTHLKPVIGIDIHFVNLPFPFIPLPHPYIGLVIDPFDYIPFIGASVKINHVPRGVTDTGGMLITFMHIPFGAGFTLWPMIGHDSQNFFGDKKVSIEGTPMSGAGYMLMTCNDIGIPLSLGFEKFKKKPIPIPSLYLPTSYVIPLQWGKPVKVGGPLTPNFDLMSMLHALAFGAFMKVFGKVGSKLLKKLNSKLPNKGLSLKLGRALCKMGFEPVDLITGRVNYEYTDFELPGAIPLQWTRNWDSDASYNGPLGHGVHMCYDRWIQQWPEDGCLTITLEDGRLAAFPLLYYGESFYHPQEKMLLRRKQNGHYLLEDYNACLYYHFNYDAETNIWRLSFIENYSGHRIQLHYAGAHLRAITDCAGRQLLFTLDKENRITRVEVKHREVSQVMANYNYNEDGDLIRIEDALGQATTIDYHDHLMIKKTDRNGQSFYWEYDNKRRCTHTWGDGGVLEGFIQYGKGYNTVTNSLGETTTYYFDENNLCVQETDHYGNHNYTQYTDDFNIYREIDAEGNITGYVYDERSRMIEYVLPNGTSEQFRYNEHNQVKWAAAANGDIETYGYDTMRRLHFVNKPNKLVLTYEYNEDGHLDTIIEKGSNKTKLTYDEDDNLASVQLPDGTSAHWKYDALGRCIQTINADGEVRYLEYDGLNRLQTLHLPNGNDVKLEYNAYEEITRVTDKYDSVQYEYTPLGSVTKCKRQNDEIRFLYDTEERLQAVINESGRRFLLDYNKRGELIGETGFDGLKLQYELDSIGRVTKMLRPGGRFTKYEYDTVGNITRIEYHDGSWALAGYDRNGRLKEIVNEHSTVRLTRNKQGLPVIEEQDGYKVFSEYDHLGNRTRVHTSLGADIQFELDNVGLVQHMQARCGTGGAWQAHMKYSQSGQELERILPGDLISEWKYDQAGRPAEHKVHRRGVMQSWKKYNWAPDERLTHIFDALSQGNTRFKHDAAGNLVFAQYADNRIVHRATDETGNIYETSGKTDRRYNASGAPLESSKYIFKYDEEGFLISKTEKATSKKTSYEWDAAGQLKKVVQPDKKVVEFTYDALGRRISKCFDGKITRWLWDNDVPIQEWTYDEQEKPKAIVNEWGDMVYDKEEPNPFNTAGIKSITWIFQHNSFMPVAKIEDGHTYSIINDFLGTPVAAYDTNGRIVWECVMDIYGRAKALTGSKNFIPFRYQGQYEDVETGLYYNRFRYYSPEEGVYICQDPAGLQAGIRFYAYVPDVNYWVDIFGLILGGSHGMVRGSNVGGEVNHIPAYSSYKNLTGVPNKPPGPGGAPAHWMSTADHKQTASWGSWNTAKAWRLNQGRLISAGNWAGAIEMDIDDISKKFPGKYVTGLKEMLDHAQKLGLISQADNVRLKKLCK